MPIHFNDGLLVLTESSNLTLLFHIFIDSSVLSCLNIPLILLQELKHVLPVLILSLFFLPFLYTFHGNMDMVSMFCQSTPLHVPQFVVFNSYC